LTGKMSPLEYIQEGQLANDSLQNFLTSVHSTANNELKRKKNKGKRKEDVLIDVFYTKFDRESLREAKKTNKKTKLRKPRRKKSVKRRI